MDIEKAKEFVKELNKLQEKHGIHITSGYSEEYDYNFVDELTLNGIESYLLLSDQDGNEITMDEVLNTYFVCQNCGKTTEGKSFCSTKCKESYSNDFRIH